MNFVTTELSAFYMNVAKDVVYIDAKDSKTRRSMQTVFYQVLVTLSKLLTPVLPHTTEEIWQYLKEPEEFVQLAEMPVVKHFDNEDAMLQNWTSFMQLRTHVLKVLEEARDAKKIGKSLEARLDLYVSDENQKMLNSLNGNVRQLLEVSDLHVAALDEAPVDALKFNDGVAVKVTPAQGDVCQRCRMTTQDVGSDSDYPQLCARCAKIVRTEFPATVNEGLEK
ncbi:class I tRNA ligase family protein [Paucilactobacillus hokkaidonensis]|nr:class I tRNA ligase family protein [Paucilactobacillus hokkaidonensis]